MNLRNQLLSAVLPGMPAAMTDMTASTMSGMVIARPLSCAWSYLWWSRGWPKKVRKTMRNM